MFIPTLPAFCKCFSTDFLEMNIPLEAGKGVQYRSSLLWGTVIYRAKLVNDMLLGPTIPPSSCMSITYTYSQKCKLIVFNSR